MKKNMKKILGVTLAACMAATSLAGCSGSPGKQTTAAPAAGEPGAGQAAQSTATGEPIKVGVSNMVTGPMAAGGIRMKQAITMAFEEINANGGVLGGRPLEMVLVDDTGTPTGAVNAVNKILGENVSVSIGPHTSPMASATQELYRKAGVPFITAATSPKLRTHTFSVFPYPTERLDQLWWSLQRTSSGLRRLAPCMIRTTMAWLLTGQPSSTVQTTALSIIQKDLPPATRT